MHQVHRTLRVDDLRLSGRTGSASNGDGSLPIGTVGGRGFNGLMTASPLVATTDLSEEQILARATVCARGMRRAGAELLVLAYEWAVAHPVDRLDPREAGKPGRERATVLGGPGTPEVTESSQPRSSGRGSSGPPTTAAS